MRFSALLLLIVHLSGCSSGRRAASDTRAVAAAGTAGERRGGDVAFAQWPSTGLPEFVFARLDLTTFRNSTGGQRERGERFLPEIGIHPTEVSATAATHDDDEWLYAVRVLGRGDFNGDRVEDVAICFIDRARNGGTYDFRQPLLLQLVGGRAVAVKYEIDTLPEAADCKPPESADR